MILTGLLQLKVFYDIMICGVTLRETKNLFIFTKDGALDPQLIFGLCESLAGADSILINVGHCLYSASPQNLRINLTMLNFRQHFAH